jgi:hypothetical protein
MEIIYSLLNKRQSMTTITLFSRQTGKVISQNIDAGQVISLTEPSVITINNHTDWATGYTRTGDDLFLATHEGATQQYRDFFVADSSGSASTLVFDNGTDPVTQAVFSRDAAGSSLTPVFEAYRAPVEAATVARSSTPASAAADVNAAADVEAADAPTITINTFAGDNIITYAEGQVEQVLSGTTTGIEAGQSLTVAFNSIVSFWTEVQADGSWQVTLNAASMYDLLRYGSTEITAESANAAGEEATTSVPFQVLSDWPSVTLNAFAGDDVISGPEDQSTQILSGSTTRVEAGQTVTLTLNGNTYTATVDAEGYWRTSVPAADVAALPDGAQLVATVTNALGREAGDSATLTVNSSLPSLTFDPFVTDNVLSDAEAQSAQTLSGTTTGVEAGQAVTVTLNEKTYSTTVAADGSFSLSVPSADLLALYSGQTTIAARATNLAGQETQGSEILTVDFATARLVVDPVAGDNYINASETSYLVLSGTTVDVPAGSWVVITFNDRIFRAEVEADGSWSTYVSDLVVNSFPDGQYPITFSAPGSAPVTLDVGLYIDNQAQFDVQIDTLFGDDVLTPDETLQDQVLTGTTGITGAGQTISAELEEGTYTGTVDNNGNWTITVPAAALQALQNPNGYVYVQAADLAGNSIAVGRSFELVFSPATLTIDPITGDNILTAAETATALTISGVSFRVPEGVTITVTLNGNDYTTTAPGNDTWSVQVPAADLAGLTDGVYTVTAATINIDLEPVTTQQDLTVDLAPAPAFSVDPVTGDDVLYASETEGEIAITGHAPVSAQGGTVTVTAFGSEEYRYTGTVAADGSWQVTVPASNFGGTSNGVYTLVAELTAPDGTVTTATHDITINQWPFTGDFYFNDFTSDGALTAAERTQDQVFSGTFASQENDVSGLTITVYMHDYDGQTFAYTGTTDANGDWQVTIPAADLQQLSEGWNYMTAIASDAAGNSAPSSREEPFAVLPAEGGSITVNPIAGDNVLTADEVGDGLTISGSSSYMGERYTELQVEINGEIRYYTDYYSDWSVTFSQAFIATLPDGPVTVTVSGYDVSGNLVTTTSTLEVDLGNELTLAIDRVTGDDVLYASETAEDLVISGRAPVSAQGGTVTLTAFDDPDYRYTGTVEANGTWHVTVPAGSFNGVVNGVYPLEAELTAPDGTVTTVTRDITLNQQLFSGSLTLDALTGDDIVNSEESAQDQILSGQFVNNDGVNHGGQSIFIQMFFDGDYVTYSTTTGEDGRWQVTIPAADLSRIPAGDVYLDVAVYDAAGNGVSSSKYFQVTTGAVGITFDPVTGDDILYVDETSAEIAITGHAPVSAQGGTITVVAFEDPAYSYTGTVAADGTWQVTVPEYNFGGTSNGVYTLVAELTAPDGTVTTATHDITINVWPFTGDFVFAGFDSNKGLTVEERTQDQVYRGSFRSDESNVGGLNITLHATDSSGRTFDFTTTTDDNGDWLVTLPATDLQQMNDGWGQMTATATDAAGNAITSSRDDSFVVMPAEGGTITVNPIAGDNVLTADEVDGGLTISGSSLYMGERYTGIEVEINGEVRYYSGYYSDWSVTFSPEFVATLPDGPVTVNISGYDISETLITTTATLEVNLSDVSTLTLNPVTGDDVISADEAGGEIVITGRAPLSTQGGTVTVTAFESDEYRYTSTVEADGTWQITVPAGVFGGRANGVYTLVAELTAPDGIVTTLNHDVTSNQQSFTGSFAFYVFAGDDVLNDEEQAQDQILDGAFLSDDGSNVAGLAVTIQMTSTDGWPFTYTTTTDENGYWRVTLPSSDLEQLRNGWVNLTGTVADGAGNTISSESQFEVMAGIGTLTINPIAGDNVLTADEIGGGLVVSGSGEFLDMPLDLQVTINGVSQGFYDYSSDWSVTFTPQQLAGFPDGPLTVTVTAYDIEFNQITATSTLTVDLGDLQPLTFNPFGGDDNYLDEDELESDQLLSGQAGDLPAGSIVTLTLGEFTYQAEVQADHSWSVLIPADDLQTLPNDESTDISATVTDADGNLLALGNHTFLLYRTPGELNIDTLAGDGILTADEANGPLVVSGTITNGRVGAAVTVDLNGHLYQTTVEASDGSWQVTVPVEDLAQLGNTEYWVSATSTDLSGNEISGLNLLTVDLYVPVITLDPIAGDNIINAAEAAAGVTISGQSSEAGGTVSVQLNGVTYDAAVNDEGTWQLTLPDSTLAELEDGRYTLTLSQTAGNGQTTTVTESLLLDADPANRPVLRIHTISHDNVLNGAEIQSDQIISGSSENVESGQTLSLKIGGVTYTTQVQPGGVWSLVVPAEALAALGNGVETLRASVTDASGNRATASRNLTIKSHQDGLSIDPVTGDNLINAADAEGAITLTGHTDGVHRGATVHLTLNGEHYTAKVGRDGSWSAKVPAADVAALEEGSATLTACVKSACGQMLYAKAVLTVDTSAPELAVSPVTGDNLISVQEAQAGFALTGSAGIAAAGLLVLVVLNGVDYHATVQADGDWSVAIPAEALADQPAGDYPLTVSLTDVAGNLTTVTSAVTLEAAPDTDATDTAALTAASQPSTAGSADSTLTAALVTPEVAAPEHGTYSIGGQTLDLSNSGGEAIGGSGDDTIVVNTLDFLHIDGGSGTDTLLLAGSDQHLDLTALGLKIENIDIFDLGNGSNSLTLGRHEAETVTDQPEESLLVLGAQGSQLTLAGDGSAWETSGQREVDGLTFDVYHTAGLESADLLVQQGILVQQV